MIVIEFEHLVAFAIALIVAFFSTPIARKLAFRAGAVTVPKEERHMHKKPMALMGGLAIILGFSVSAVYSFAVNHSTAFSVYMGSIKFWGAFSGALVIIATGIVDDIHPLKARVKFPLQLLAAVLAAASGIQITVLSKPFANVTVGLPHMMINLGTTLSFIITVFWIVGVTNAINLIDGLDGLAAGVSGIACISLFVVAVVRHQANMAILLIALVGAIVGFLPYNFNPAKIFMGDTGSTFLGYLMAVLSIAGAMKSVATISLVVPLLVLGLPIFDTAFAILRRVINGRPIGEADRGHIHHRLVDMGLSHRSAVTVLYIVSGALGLVSISLADKGILVAILLLVVILVFMIGGARNLSEMAGEHEKHVIPRVRIAKESRGRIGGARSERKTGGAAEPGTGDIEDYNESED